MTRIKCKLILMLIAVVTGCASDPKHPNTHLKAEEQEVSASQSPSKSTKQKSIDYKTAALLNIQLGLDYLASNQIDRAKTKLFKAQKLSPNLPELYVAFGQYYDKLGETAAAEQYYLKGISLKPGSGEAYNTYGTFLCRHGKYDKADKQFNYALKDKEYTQTAMILENAGLCALENKSTSKYIEKSKAYFEHALRQDPNRPHALLELGFIKMSEQAFEEAQVLYKRYTMISEQNARSLDLGIKLARHFKDKNKEASYLLLLKTINNS